MPQDPLTFSPHTAESRAALPSTADIPSSRSIQPCRSVATSLRTSISFAKIVGILHTEQLDHTVHDREQSILYSKVQDVAWQHFLRDALGQMLSSFSTSEAPPHGLLYLYDVSRTTCL